MSTVVAQHTDPSLPGLHIALDAGALLDALTLWLPECRNGIQLLDAHVVDVQYKPGSGAQVLWKLRVHDAETGRTARQLVHVKALRRGRSAPPEPVTLIERYRQRRALGRDLALHTPWLYATDANLLVQAFPLDPVLPTLLEVTDPFAMREALHRAWQPRRVRVRSVRADTLSYTPEARAALSFQVLAEHKDTALPELRRLVGKLHVNCSPARLFAGHWAVWRGSGGRGVAPPTGYVSLAQLSLQEFVPGTRLSDLAGTGTFIGLLRRTAHIMARIHSLTLPLLSTRGVNKELAAVDRWIGILSRLRPAHATRLERLQQRLRRELAEHARIIGTVHADFHLANVLAEQDDIRIIDWDQAAHGDPMVDVARVLASLRVSSLRVHNRLDGFADEEAAFLATYLARTGEDERRARLFEAAALLISAAGPFRLQRAGWEEGAELMLDEVDRILDLSLRGERVAGTTPESKRHVPFALRTKWALDPTYVQALLVPVVHATHGGDIEVTECTPRLQEQSRDHLHMRWVVKGYRGRERWRGAVDGLAFAEHRGRGVLSRLEQAQQVPADALQLPRPLGYLEPLRMLAFAPPEGTALEPLLGGPHEARALQTLARSLARFHTLELELGKQRDTACEIESVERRVAELARAAHAEAGMARAVFEKIRPRVAALGERRAPTVQGLDLVRVRISDARAGVALLDDVFCAEPLLSVAGLLVQLRVRAMRRGGPAAEHDTLAFAYLDAAGELPDALAVCEALLLVRRACSGRALKGSDPLVPQLLSAARSLLETGP